MNISVSQNWENLSNILVCTIAVSNTALFFFLNKAAVYSKGLTLYKAFGSS